MNRIILQPTGGENADDFKKGAYIQWAEKDIARYRKIWKDSVGDTVLFINISKIFAISMVEKLVEFDGHYPLGYYWNENIKFVDIPLNEINRIIGYKENYFPRNYMLIKEDNINEVFDFLESYEYINLIENFKLEMQNGKEFKIRTISNNSSFTCYMTLNSNTLKMRTSTGNERYTTFLNLERYFKNERVKDEVSYVKAICEWLKNKNMILDSDDIPEQKKELETEEVITYPRNEQYKNDALKLAHFKCEVDENHITFISKKTRKNYVEGHHLIPMKSYSEFDNSIDVRANIVSLCPTCHRQLHSGINTDVDKILNKLYDSRKERLMSVGLEITLDELQKIYYKELLE